MIAILVLIVMHSLALRWLRINGYNRQLRESLAALASLRELESEAQIAPTVTIAGQNDAKSINVASTSAQEIRWEETADAHIRDLLRYVTLTALLIGGWFIWSDVLPALRILDRVALWNNIVDMSEMVSGPDGKTSLQTFEISLPTTLKDGIVAVLTLVATCLIARRLPTVLELIVLERLPIDRGGRDAIAILVRYATMITGVIVSCKMIHISWNSVQWLAAAMTVGLGFGLQEIFANLVSGIIILFERPIRAGDIVTVGDVTGHVTAMRIRATTITDYDRRELIVPNKRFITDNVINWTLTDQISRAIVKVGVAYGSDTDRVEQILLSVARRSPMTLSTPEPTVVFVGFGDSSLDFELRVFIARRETYPQVVHALNSAINRELRSAEIEIPFPQRDLNIRGIPSEWSQASEPEIHERRNAA
jgi:potassium efflux system protein